jgi:hypothetical protein
LAPRLDLFILIFQLARSFEAKFPAATLTSDHLNRFCRIELRLTVPQKFTKSVFARAMLWLSPWSMQSFGISATMRGIMFDYASGPPALGCRVGKQSNDNGVRLGFEGLSASMRWKKFPEWQFAEICEAANTDLSNIPDLF